MPDQGIRPDCFLHLKNNVAQLKNREKPDYLPVISRMWAGYSCLPRQIDLQNSHLHSSLLFDQDQIAVQDLDIDYLL